MDKKTYNEMINFYHNINKERKVKKIIIGFGYKKGCGKTTLSDYIIEDYIKDKKPWYAGKISFAESLKAIAVGSFGWDEKKDEKGRRLLQEIGSTARHYKNDFWVDIVVKSIRKTLDYIFNTIDEADILPNILILVDDARYPNEVEGLRKLQQDGVATKTIIIRIDRDTGFVDGHSSEHGLDEYVKWDYIIDNNGSMEELKNKVNEILIKEEVIDEGIEAKFNNFIFEQILKEDILNDGFRA